MALTAKKVYAILKRQISDMEAKLNSPVRYRGTVATADLLPLNPDIGDMYNIESKSVYGEAGMNVAWNGVVWDTMGAPIDMSLYLTKEEAETVIQRLVTEYFEKNPVKPGATTEQAQQIEQNKTDIASLKTETGSLREDLSNKITKFYASSQGENHLADSDNGKIQDMMVYGKSEQKQYSGKNLIPPITYSGNISGLQIDVKEGLVRLKGTPNAEVNYPVFGTWSVTSPTLFTLRAGDYTASGCGDTSNPRVNLVYLNNGRLTSINGNKAFTLDKDANFVAVFVFADANKYVDITFTPMIEKGSTATSYEPYTGGIPSPNPDYPQEIKSVVNPTVKVCGKNLLELPISNKSTQAGITFEVINDSVIKITGINDGSRASQYIAYNSQDVKHAKLIPYKNIAITISTYNDDVIAGLAYWLKSENYATVHYKQNKRKCTIDLGEDAKIVPWFFIPQNGTYTNNTVKFGVYYGTDELTYDSPKCQTVTLPYTLNAIPVNSGGNVTIDGQQYVSDYVDVERGKLVRMVDDVEAKNYIWKLYSNANNMVRRFGMNDVNRFNMPDNINVISPHFKQIAYTGKHDLSVWFQSYYLVVTDTNAKWENSEALIQWFSENNVHFYLPLKTPTETDLPKEEITAFKALATYYPTTNISVNSEQLDGYTVFNYPISMENGWNYVKQQIGDTRDYIYDMDIQSAEAYVNSEYAVALTDLEV